MLAKMTGTIKDEKKNRYVAKYKTVTVSMNTL